MSETIKISIGKKKVDMEFTSWSFGAALIATQQSTPERTLSKRIEVWDRKTGEIERRKQDPRSEVRWMK